MRFHDVLGIVVTFALDDLGQFLFGKKTIGKSLICQVDVCAGVVLRLPFFSRTLIGDDFQSKVKGEAAKPDELTQVGNFLRERTSPMKR
ncbi:MAG: hypothetical protein IAG10_22820 [Planctomycetaceae bacterium]|nr:hypothetical protein [Planctomycetaceae bacterium]